MDAHSIHYAVLAVVSNCCPPLKGRFLTRYSPVRHFPQLQSTEVSIRWFSFDLHVLGTPPAFVLSQDQTLKKLYLNSRRSSNHSSINLSSKFYSRIFVGLNSFTRNLNNSFIVQGVLFVFALFNLQGTFARRSRGELDYSITRDFICQEVFSTFYKFLSLSCPCSGHPSILAEASAFVKDNLHNSGTKNEALSSLVFVHFYQPTSSIRP